MVSRASGVVRSGEPAVDRQHPAGLASQREVATRADLLAELDHTPMTWLESQWPVGSPLGIALALQSVVAAGVTAATAEVNVIVDDPQTTINRSLHAAKLEFDEGHIEAVEGTGLYEVSLDAGTYIHVTPDGKYIVAGDLFEVRGEHIVGITDSTRRAKRRESLTKIPPETMITFAPNSGTGAAVVVFTDTDCQYCRRLHSDVPDYLARRIEIRYAAYPRGGPESPAYADMVSAWCATDRHGALSAPMRGEDIERLSCDSPVAQHYRIGEQMGVTGTPTIVLPDGRVFVGVLSSDHLAEVLGLEAAAIGPAASDGVHE